MLPQRENFEIALDERLEFLPALWVYVASLRFSGAASLNGARNGNFLDAGLEQYPMRVVSLGFKQTF